METGKSKSWVAASLAAVAVLAASVQAGWVDHFDQPTDFDPRWGLDIPAPAKASITLDTTNDLAHFAATQSTNMWTDRADAPILWTASPAGDFYIETHVMASPSQNDFTAGLTVYGDGIGASDDGEKPDFVFQLNQWKSATRLAHLQGLGNNSPSISAPATGGEAWLRLNLARDAGAGGLDRYVVSYKLHESDPWSALAVLDRDVANARAGLFFKTGANALREADLSYAALQERASPLTLAVMRTWDFETGDLSGWNIVNTTHGSQPSTVNAVFTTPGNQPAVLPHSGNYDVSTIQGDYWIRTWEGEVLGTDDRPTGIIETDPFVLLKDAWFDLLVGGGNHPFYGDPDAPSANMACVTLERLVGPDDWEAIFTATGRNNNSLLPVVWDASDYAGDTARLRIYDTISSGWGHIGVDNIVYSAAPEPATLTLLGLSLVPILRRRRR